MIEKNKQYTVIYKMTTYSNTGTPYFWLVLYGVDHEVGVTALTYARTSYSSNLMYAPKIKLKRFSLGGPTQAIFEIE